MRHLACVQTASFLHPLSSDRAWTCRSQSFAKIAHADAAQLARLPGFGPKKVARLKDTFERPFRTGTAGDALPAPGDGPAVSASASTSATAAASAPAVPALSSSSRGGGNGRTGEDAVWDIELDLNSPWPELAPAKRAREERESPPWDIELDEGAPLPSGDEVSISSDDTDADIAPALRAKRRRA